jgi:hypothetical protein
MHMYMQQVQLSVFFWKRRRIIIEKNRDLAALGMDLRRYPAHLHLHCRHSVFLQTCTEREELD